MKFNILLLLISSFASMPTMEVQTNEISIIWQEGHLLTWSDFKGRPENPNSVASTSYDIIKRIIDYGDSATIIIRAVFFPYKSWKRKGRNDEDILIHEQRHFDIAELYARKLRKSFS